MKVIPIYICICLFFFALLGCGEQPETNHAVITLWAHEGQPAEKKALQAIVARFNASSPRLRIDLQLKQEQGYGNRVNAAAIAHALPDILDVDAPYTAQLADTGILTALDPLLPDSMRSDFYPASLQQGCYRDSLYTLGAFESTVVLYYNAKMLRACDIVPAVGLAQAWDWQTFIANLQKIKTGLPDVLPLETYMPWGGEWLTYAFLPVLWSNNATVLATGNPPKCTLDSPEAIAALQDWQTLFQNGLADANAPVGLFERGQAAMAWGIFNRWPLLQADSLDFGMMPLPKFRTLASPMGSWRWGITSTSAKKRLAARVLQWLLDARKGILPMCEANGGIPARKSAAALMPDYARTRGLFLQQLDHSAHPRPITPAYGSITLHLSRAFSDIANGSDVRAVVARTQAEIERALARFQ